MLEVKLVPASSLGAGCLWYWMQGGRGDFLQCHHMPGPGTPKAGPGPKYCLEGTVSSLVRAQFGPGAMTDIRPFPFPGIPPGYSNRSEVQMNMGSAGLYPHIIQYGAPSLLVPALALPPHLCFSLTKIS